MSKVIKTYARVSMAADLALTVEIPNDATKADVRRAVQQQLRSITDADDGITIAPKSFTPGTPPRVYPPHKNETTDHGTVFTLKGLEVLDTFNEEVEEDPKFN